MNLDSGDKKTKSSVINGNIKYITITAMLAIIMYISQVVLAFLPNIELVSFFVVVFVVVYGLKAFPIIGIFIIAEGLTYGFGLWWINYLYVWFILAFVTLIFRKSKSVLVYSSISAFFGLSFGFLCSLTYLFVGNFASMFAYWVAGIMFDVTHCISNFVIMLILYKPIYFILNKLNK